MKINSRKVLLVLLTLAISHITAASNITIAPNVNTPFNGFYVGAFAGAVRICNSLEFNISNNVARVWTMNPATNTFTGFLYGLMAGYGRNLNGCYLGAEIGIQSDSTNKLKDYTFPWPGGSVTVKAKYQRGLVLSIAPRLGAVLCGSYMVYVKPALEMSKDKIVAADGDGSKKKWKYVFVPSVGLERAFSNSMLVRAEYSYNLGSKITEKVEENGFTGSVSLKYTSHALKLGLAYQF